MELREIVPNPEDFLSLEVEELAGVLLLHLNSRSDQLHHYNFFVRLNSQPVYGAQYRNLDQRISRALMEAWDWLASEGFLAKQGDDSTGFIFFITRRGQRMKSREDFAAYRKANLFPRGHLHPLIASKVYPTFLRGEYDTAIFQSFREIEVAVRQAVTLRQRIMGLT
jgi:hypothetical protein